MHSNLRSASFLDKIRCLSCALWRPMLLVGLLGASAPSLRAQDATFDDVQTNTLEVSNNATIGNGLTLYGESYANDYFEFGDDVQVDDSLWIYNWLYASGGATFGIDSNIQFLIDEESGYDINTINDNNAVADWVWSESAGTITQMSLDTTGVLNVYDNVGHTITLDPGNATISIGNFTLIKSGSTLAIGGSGQNVSFTGNAAFSSAGSFTGLVTLSGGLNLGNKTISNLEGGNATAPALSFNGSTSTGLFSPSANTLALTANGTEDLRVTSSGNIGIGTTSPVARLTVKAASGANAFSVLDPSNNLLFAIDSGGNVGIGSPGPEANVLLNVGTNYFSTALSNVSLTGISSYINDTPASNSSTYITGGQFEAQWNGNGTNASNSIAEAVYAQSSSTLASPGVMKRIDGIQSIGVNEGSGTVSFIDGISAGVINESAGGSISFAIGGEFGGSVSNNGTISGLYGVYIDAPGIGSGGTITNNYGLYLENQSGATGNNYAIYSAGGHSYFAGNIGIAQTNPAYGLDVSGTGHFTGLVTASGGLTSSGNLGIGNTTPDSALTVTGGNLHLTTNGTGVKFSDGSLLTSANLSSIYAPGGSSGVISVSSGSNVSVSGNTTFSAPVAIAAGNATAPSLSFSGNASTGLFAPANNTLALSTNGTERLAVTSSGNIGIGTGNNSLASALTVNGTVNFNTASGNTVLVTTSGGNVGIGNTTPTARLTVQGADSASTDTALAVGNSTSIGWAFQNDNSLHATSLTSDLIWDIGTIGNETTAPLFLVQNMTAGHDQPLFMATQSNVYSSNYRTLSVHFYEDGSSVRLLRFYSDATPFMTVADNPGEMTTATLDLYPTLEPTAAGYGNGTQAIIHIAPTIDLGAGYNGTINGIDIANPSISHTPNWRSILLETNSGAGLYGIYESGTAANYFAGNIGLGNTTPDSSLTLTGGNLHVTTSGTGVKFADGSMLTSANLSSIYAPGGNSSVISINSAGNVSVSCNTTFSAPLAIAAGAPTAPALSFGGNASTGLFAPTSNTIALAANGIEGLRVTSSGNIGIGTPVANSTLTVNGTVQLNTTTGSPTLAVDTGGNVTIPGNLTVGASTPVANTTLAVNGTVNFNTPAGNTTLAVDSSGDLTVGNTTSGAANTTVTFAGNTATTFNGTVVFGQAYGDIAMGQYGD